MKKIISSFRKGFFTLAVLAISIMPIKDFAQTLVMPTMAPNVWDNIVASSPGVMVPGLNTALINIQYSPLLSGFIAAYAAWDGGSNIYANLTDLSYFGGSYGIFYGFSTYGTPIGTPDIVLCNDPLNTPNEYFIAAIAYPTTAGVEVDYFSFKDVTGTISLVHRVAVSTYAMTIPPTTVHLDGVANYANFSTTGFPYCKRLVVTWDDPFSGNIDAEPIDLSGIPGTLLPNIIATGVAPDVAAIRRTVGFAQHEFALFTYTDIGGSQLYYKEWDISAGTFSSVTVLDPGTTGTPIVLPRIDAIDDYNNNSSSLQANYKVVAQVNDGVYSTVRTYDNTLVGGLPPYWTSSSVVTLPNPPFGPPPYNHYAPAVAMGGPYVSYPARFDATSYLVTDFTHYNGNNDILMMEPIDYANSTWLAYTGGIDNYYWVSESAPLSVNGYYANSVSSPCNNPSTENGTSLIAWGYPDGFGNTNIEYKFTPYYYTFRPGGNSNPANNANLDWKIYPIPSSSSITIDNPGATGESACYKIFDIAGRLVLKGPLANGQQQIDISNLSIGSYIVKASNEDGPDFTKIIIKN